LIDDNDDWVKMCYFGGWGRQTEVGPVVINICTKYEVSVFNPYKDRGSQNPTLGRVTLATPITG